VIVFENAGRTPALNFMFETQFNAIVSPLPVHPEYEKAATLPSVTLLPAGGTTRQVFFTGRVVEPSDIERVKAGRLLLYVYGIARYDDGLGRHHTLKYCGFYVPTKDVFSFCPSHNGTD
jgi:hypothetical protein